MKYVGLQSQIRRNNTRSILLLLAFPTILLLVLLLFLVIINYLGSGGTDANGFYQEPFLDTPAVTNQFVTIVPWVILGVLIWFGIAYFNNTSMIRRATGAQPLLRRDNPRVYNIVENLTMTCGMPMPQVNVIDDPQLNAFASGIDDKTYTVTVTTGLLDRLNDDELAGVIGHELTHIRNRDTRLLITSIIFVGIISTVMTVIARVLLRLIASGAGRRRSSNGKNAGLIILVALIVGLVCAAIAYFFTLLTRFAISRKREYMADAGGAELCGNPLALASALRKISHNPGLGDIEREDIAQMYIIRPWPIKGLAKLFNTHPSIERRIQILEQF